MTEAIAVRDFQTIYATGLSYVRIKTVEETVYNQKCICWMLTPEDKSTPSPATDWDGEELLGACFDESLKTIYAVPAHVKKAADDAYEKASNEQNGTIGKAVDYYLENISSHYKEHTRPARRSYIREEEIPTEVVSELRQKVDQKLEQLKLPPSLDIAAMYTDPKTDDFAVWTAVRAAMCEVDNRTLSSLETDYFDRKEAKLPQNMPPSNYNWDGENLLGTYFSESIKTLRLVPELLKRAAGDAYSTARKAIFEANLSDIKPKDYGDFDILYPSADSYIGLEEAKLPKVEQTYPEEYGWNGKYLLGNCLEDSLKTVYSAYVVVKNAADGAYEKASNKQDGTVNEAVDYYLENLSSYYLENIRRASHGRPKVPDEVLSELKQSIEKKLEQVNIPLDLDINNMHVDPNIDDFAPWVVVRAAMCEVDIGDIRPLEEDYFKRKQG